MNQGVLNGTGAKAFQALCRAHGIKQSMGSVGDCYDNAQAEFWFATLKRESVLPADPLKSAEALRRQIIRYIESWYKTRRLHSSLGYMSPIDYEAQLKKKRNRSLLPPNWAEANSQTLTSLPYRGKAIGNESQLDD